jgi:hypothetical protein
MFNLEGESMKRQLLYACALILIAVISLILFLILSIRNPFYFIWDMDHITMIDMLLINSGRLPDHLNHTALGMYLFMRLTCSVASVLGVLATFRLEDVGAALNPLLPVAELTTFLRLHSPFVILMIAGAGFTSIVLVSRVAAASLAGIFIFAALALQQWTTYHATMVRSEIYALLYWQLAVLAIAIAAWCSVRRVQIPTALASGTLLGLALITKFQSFPYVAAYYVIVKFILDFRADQFVALGRLYDRRQVYFVLTNLIGLVIFGTLAAFAWKHQLSPGSFVISNTAGPVVYRPNLMAITFLALAIRILAVQVIHSRATFIRRLVSTHDLALFSLIQAGYACAAFSAILAFYNPTVAWSYTIENFKVAYFRQFTSEGVLLTLQNVWDALTGFARYYPVLMLLCAGSLVLVAVLPWMIQDRGERENHLKAVSWATLALGLFIIGTVFYRFYVRDMIWHESLPTFLTVLLLAVASSTVRERWPNVLRRKLATGIVIVPLAALIAFNLAQVSTLVFKTDLNYNVYGWSTEHLRMGYGGNQQLYRRLVDRIFPAWKIDPQSNAGIALRHATLLPTITRAVSFVLPYQKVPLTKIGAFVPSNPIWVGDEARLLEVPSAWRGAILVDLRGLLSRPRSRLIDGSQVNIASEAFEKITDRRATEKLGILIRADLDIVLFSANDSTLSSGATCDLQASIMSADSRANSFCGQIVSKYLEFDYRPDWNAFLVIRPKFGI